jgi:hypothetical protein
MKLQKVNPSDYEIYEGKQRHCVLPGTYFMLKNIIECFVLGLMHYIRPTQSVTGGGGKAA